MRSRPRLARAGVTGSLLLAAAILAPNMPHTLTAVEAASTGLDILAVSSEDGTFGVSGIAPSQSDGVVRLSVRVRKTQASGKRVLAWKLVATGKVNPDNQWAAVFETPAEALVKEDRVLIRVAVRTLDGAALIMDTSLSRNQKLPNLTSDTSTETFDEHGPAGDSSSHKFLAYGGNGQPAHWSRCEPVNYWVNPQDAPDGAQDTIARAFAELSEATGQQFIYAGGTDSTPFEHNNRIDTPNGPGIYLAFGGENLVPGLAGDVIGLAALQAKSPGNGQDDYAYAGGVVIDVDNELVTLYEILLHEMGHAYGLGHVDDASQVMNPNVPPNTNRGYQAGDISGLQALASRPCR